MPYVVLMPHEVQMVCASCHVALCLAQVWYESAKQAVLTIGEHTLSNAVTKRSSGEEGDTEVEALLDTLV